MILMLGAGALGMTQRDGMGREEGSGWGTHVYLCQIHFYIWQNQYNIVKLKKKKKTYLYGENGPFNLRKLQFTIRYKVKSSGP